MEELWCRVSGSCPSIQISLCRKVVDKCSDRVESLDEKGMTDQVDLYRSTVPITGDPIGVLTASEEYSVKDIIHIDLSVDVPIVLW